jgi:hypothetical protein
MNNAFEEGENLFDDNGNDKYMLYSQQLVETECKTPCSSSAIMCIAMCT